MVRRWALALLLVSGCNGIGLIQGSDGIGDPTPPPPPPPAAPVGLITSPHHGQLGAPGPLAILGEVDQPGVALSVELRGDSPQWQVVVRVHSEPTPAADGAYAFTAFVSQDAQQLVWPAGGIMRLRVVTADGRALGVLADDQEGSDCLAAHGDDDLPARVEACAYPVHDGLVLVDPGLSPLDTDDRPRFLDRKGAGDADETAAYYAAHDLPATLADFQTRYGLGAPAETTAAYYNQGDLAVGRDMHCVRFDADGGGVGLACASSNFGAFSGDQADSTEQAISGHESGLGAFATVCMVFTPPIDAPDSVVFVVYGGDGQQVTSAQLDQYGDNTGVPQNCLNCHGAGSTYDPVAHSTQGARFLPFDPAALGYSTRSGYSFAEQAESLRQLNALVSEAGAAPGVAEVISHLYPAGVDTTGAAAQVEFIPTGWSGSAADRAIYRHAIAPYCRGCHQTHALGNSLDALTFGDAATFRQQRDAIARDLCGAGHAMPNAEVVARRFWASPARAYLADDLGLDACSPSVLAQQ
jgi:hypothetical protein